MIARRKKNIHLGLLPRMDAYKRKGGGFTYRYKRYDGSYLPLGTDRAAAVRRVLELEHRAPGGGTIASLVREYLSSGLFKGLSPRTQLDYIDASKHVLGTFGEMDADSLEPRHIAKYLRIERADAPVRANREMAFLSSVLNLGIEMGSLTVNPCRQVRRNKEKPRHRLPTPAEVAALYEVAKAKGDSSKVIGLMARFAANIGRRRAEFLRLSKSQIGEDGITVKLAKGKANEADRYALLEWTDELREIIREAQSTPRPVGSMYVFVNRAGQPYTESGFKAMWTKVMADYVASGGEHFTFHDLRALFVSGKMDKGENPETHKNPATQKRVYDRRRVVKVKPLE